MRNNISLDLQLYSVKATDQSCQVAGSEQAPSVEGEEDEGHGGQDEVVEGNVHRCLTAPVRRWYQTRDTQRGSTLDLTMKQKDNGSETRLWRSCSQLEPIREERKQSAFSTGTFWSVLSSAVTQSLI